MATNNPQVPIQPRNPLPPRMGPISPQGLDALARVRQAAPITEEAFASKPFVPAAARPKPLPVRGLGGGVLGAVGGAATVAGIGEFLGRQLGQTDMIKDRMSEYQGGDSPVWAEWDDQTAIGKVFDKVTGNEKAPDLSPSPTQHSAPLAMPPRPSHAQGDGPYKFKMDNGTIAFTDQRGMADQWAGRGEQDKGFTMPDPNKIMTFNADAYLDRKFGPLPGRGGPTQEEVNAAELRRVQDKYGDTPLDRRMAGKTFTVGTKEAKNMGWDDYAQLKMDTNARKMDIAERLAQSEMLKAEGDYFKNTKGDEAQDAYYRAMANKYNTEAANTPTKQESQNERLRVEREKKLADMLSEINKTEWANPDDKAYAIEQAYAWARGEKIEKTDRIKAEDKNFLYNLFGIPDIPEQPPTYKSVPYGNPLPPRL